MQLSRRFGRKSGNGVRRHNQRITERKKLGIGAEKRHGDLMGEKKNREKPEAEIARFAAELARHEQELRTMRKRLDQLRGGGKPKRKTKSPG
jgi:ubiquinone biosynthesis protein UbiJ